MKQRFSEHGSLYADLSCLDPNNFAEISIRIPSDRLQHLSELPRRFDDSVTKEQLQKELLDFGRKWESFKTTLEENYNLLFDTEIRDIESEAVPMAENSNSNRNKCKSCRKLLFAVTTFSLNSICIVWLIQICFWLTNSC